jgi:hypothetical protein
MNNRRVFNIALTGPYGSGKSSIIQSILKQHKSEYNGRVLEISLAAFMPENEPKTKDKNDDPDKGDQSQTQEVHATKRLDNNEVSKQEIERSILQQMLYGADANKLPRSRFKRIQSQSLRSGFNSAYILLGILACWYLLANRSNILSGAFLSPLTLDKWLNFTALGVGVCFVWQILHHLYVASLGISLKSVSLKDIELAPAEADKESILNRHLDEIIYFFKSTPYILVIFEDLDRFNNHQIFVTLREINSLINKNFAGRRRVRFLYALRDDMFTNTDRTKFFEFIIPVIPIINSSNSIDLVTKQTERLLPDLRPSDQFLREVCRYLDDLRLIRNIFNEYKLYQAKLKMNGELVLDPTNLFAVLIYKNVFPSDFEQLHRGKGKLARIFLLHNDYILKAEKEHKAEIAKIEQQIEIAEKQLPCSLLELRRIYAMALVAKIPAPYSSIGLQHGANIHVAQLAESDLLEQMIVTPNLTVSTPQGHNSTIRLANFESEVDPSMTFQHRKTAIERKSLAFKEDAQKHIQALRTELSEIRKKEFHILIREGAKGTESLFEVFGEQADLARFLVLEGYIDDTYHLYTSLFHGVRLSPNDSKFLKLVRGFRNPEPDFPINNPQEVIEEMRDGDFIQAYILNVTLVDTLLENQSAYASQISSFVEFTSTHFKDCEAFFQSYYAIGKNVDRLIALLANLWDGFVETAMACLPNMSHLARILAYLPESELAGLQSSHPHLAQFVSEKLPAILAEGIEIELPRLQVINVQVVELSALAASSAVARYLYENGLYQVSVSNLDFIFREYLDQQDLSALHLQHYSSIQDVSDPALTKKIEADFKTYFHEVLLKLETNTNESVEAILAVLENDELAADDLRSFLGRQLKLLPKLMEIPERLYVAVLELEKIEPTWDNCLAFFSSDAYDEGSLIKYLNSQASIEALSQEKITTSKTWTDIRRFLLSQEKLLDEAYRKYVHCQPGRSLGFPTTLGPQKLTILIEEGGIQLSAKTFDELSSHPELQVLFVAKNIGDYLQDPDRFAVDDGFREKLLNSDIEDKDRIAIINAMDMGQLATIPARAAVIGSVLVRTGADIGPLDEAPITALLRHTFPVSAQIKLFNRFQDQLPDSLVPQLISELPKPFCDITRGNHIPRLPETAENRTFADMLKRRGIISSWGGGTFLNSDLRIYLFKK